LPAVVVLLSLFALVAYPTIDVNVVPLTALLYAAGLAYYLLWARKRGREPAHEGRQDTPHLGAAGGDDGETGPQRGEVVGRRAGWLERVTAAALAAVLAVAGWVALARSFPGAAQFAPAEVLAVLVLCLVAVALLLLIAVALKHTRADDAARQDGGAAHGER
jgi:hypothetical protein